MIQNLTYFDKTDIHEGFHTNLDLESALILLIFTDFWRDSKLSATLKTDREKTSVIADL